ncbi:MAG: carboxypeptidase regulatory-like domain-containing protein [Planctomycetota bacterium]
MRERHLTLGSARTAPDGSYRLTGLPARSAQVSCSKDGKTLLGWREVVLQPGREQTLDFVVHPGIEVSGTVTDRLSGRPIIGATVTQWGRSNGGATTDGAGHYSLITDAAHPSLFVRASGYVAVLTGELVGSEAFDISLDRGGGVCGRVVGPDGRGLGGAIVAVAHGVYPRMAGPDTTRSTRTAKDGSFELAELPGFSRFDVAFRCAGMGTRSYEDLRAPPVGDRLDLGEIRLVPAGSVEGRVVDEHHRPAEGVVVRLVGSNEDRAAFASATEAPSPGSVAGPGGREPFSTYHRFRGRGRITGSDGRFCFGEVCAGTYVVEARVPGIDDRGFAGDIVVRDGLPTTDVMLRVRLGGAIEGRVTYEGGAEMSGGEKVSLEISGPGNKARLVWTMNGRFRLQGLREGEVRILPRYVPAGWFLSPVENVKVGRQDLELVMARWPKVSGRVVDQDGKLRPFANLVIKSEAGIQLKTAKSDRSGRFEVMTPPPGPYEVWAWVAGDVPLASKAQVVVAGQKDVELVLR